MLKPIVTFIFALLLTQAATAQQSIIKGKVLDTLEKKALPHAVISLLNKKDSTLSSFTRSNAKGEFLIPKVNPGKYLLLVTYPKFADYSDELVVNNSHPVTDLGKIALTLKAKLMEEVIIRSGQAIRIKGDTTEFAADSFAVKEGATVEELLKKLPGFQVNSKGEITAGGKNVGKVLVDGEEFFGDDPTMATQNISAKAVDKVQVYDTKSEQQQLTGMTTGNEGKTVNIKLKENSKKGAFGKLIAGSDFHNYLDAKALYNKFVGKEKISFYGTKSNLNTGSLNWEDRQKLGIEDNGEYDEVSGYYSSIGGYDDFRSSGGLPDAYSAGGLYNNKWKEDKKSINTSYRYNRLGTTSQSNSISQSVIPVVGVRYTTNTSNSNGLRQQHAANGRYEWKLDSLATIRFTTAGAYKTGQNFNRSKTSTSNAQGDMVNENEQSGNNDTKQVRMDNQLQYKQLFKKKNRQLLVNLRYGLVDDEMDGFNMSDFKYYEQDSARSTIIDQKKSFRGNSQTYGSRISYNEPLSEKWNLVTDYSLNKNSSNSNHRTYNESGNGKYESLDTRYSNHFDLDAVSNSGTALLRFRDKKMNFGFGSGLSSVNLKLHNIDLATDTAYRFVNFTPQAQFSYNLKQQTNFSVSYRGTTRQPSIEQLQPMRNNNDELNIYIGNPALKVGFNHNVSASYYNYKVLSSTSLWFNGGYNILNNAITTASTYDTLRGKRTYTPVNVNGNKNWYFYGNWNKGGGDKKWRHSIQMNGNGGRNISFINAVKGINRNNYFEMNYGIGYEVTDKYNFNVRPKIAYNSSKSSLRQGVNTDYYSYGGNIYGYVQLPWKLEINSDVYADLRQQTPGFNRNVNRIMWNASIVRKVLKKNAGKIILSGNDLLNQNKGYFQTIGADYSYEGRSQQISRYFLLKFEWTFNKMPGGK